MATERDVYTIETAEAQKNLDALTDSTKKLKEEVKDGEKHHKNFGDLWKDHITEAFLTAQAAFELTKRALEAIGETIKEGVEEYLKQEQAIVRLDYAMRNVGESSEIFKKRFEFQAKQIEATTGASEEHTIKLQTMLLAMGVGADEVERFTKASYNLATVMGQDATVAAKLLARAHAEGKEELKKYGITLDDVREQGVGFDAVLTQVEKQVGDINSKMPESVKALNEYKAAWEDLKKEIGHLALIGIGSDDPLSLLNIGKRILEIKRARDEANLPVAPKGETMDLPEMRVDVISEAARKRAEQHQIYLEKIRRDERDLRDETEQSDQEFAATQFITYDQMNKARVEAERQKLKDLDELHKEEIDNDEEMMRQQLMAQNAAANAEEEKENAHIEKMKQIRNEALQDLEGYARQATQFLTNIFEEGLTSNTSFSRSMKEQAIQRQLVGLDEQKASEKRVELEKRMADEEKAAFAKRLSSFLAHLAAESAGKAIFEAAAALASAAEYDYGGAAMHGAAAAAFAGVAAVAGGAAYAISSTRGMTTEERQQLEDAKDAQKSRAERESKNASEKATGVATQVNQYIMGISGFTEAEQGAELERIRRKYEDLKTGSGGGRG